MTYHKARSKVRMTCRSFMCMSTFLVLAGCMEGASTPVDTALPETGTIRPTTVSLNNYEVGLRFADGRRCTIPAYLGERDGTEDGWSRYETDCDGITSLRVEFLPPLRPGPPDPTMPDLPPAVPDYTGRLDIVRLPSPDLEGAEVTIRGTGGLGQFTHWPGRNN